MKILSKNIVGFAHYKQSRVIESILENPSFQSTFADLEQKKNQPISKSKKKARGMLRELSSAYSANALRVCYWIVRLLKRFMFDDIILYGDEIKEIFSLTNDGKILFYLPNHKSHMDYLLLSYSLFNGEVAPPHIAAGVNLAFFPVGTLFRKAGAYFIRRKIKGNFLYTKSLQNYLEWMLDQKISQEFYMEGGRSRDGKIRKAQSGILTLLIEQVVEKNLQDLVYLVPTAITYDRVPEMKSLLKELEGFDKEPESVASILSSISWLWTDHGNVHVQFGKPIALTSLISKDFSKKESKRISRQIFKKVQSQKIITVSSLVALVVLSFQHEVSKKELSERVSWMIQFLKPCRQCVSAEVTNVQKDWEKVLKRFESWNWFADKGETLLINADKRLEMNYYKNDLLPALMHFFQDNSDHVLDILDHQFLYASNGKSVVNASDAEKKFLQQIIQPILSLHIEVQQQIEIQNITNALDKNFQKQIFAMLKETNFAFPEMITTEAIQSACEYFHGMNLMPKPVLSKSSSLS